MNSVAGSGFISRSSIGERVVALPVALKFVVVLMVPMEV
jgi:hypothetical protein